MRTITYCSLSILAFMMAGCASDGTETAAKKTNDQTVQDAPTPPPPASTGEPAKDLVQNASYWGALYSQNASNTEAATNYAKNLRKLGSVNKAHSILVEAISANPSSASLRAEYGKTLLVMGRTPEAVNVLEQAAELAPKNWQVQSAAGIALDQAGDHSGARLYYEAALALAPNNATVLNNYGLSRALGGDLAEAEVFLRRAVETGVGTPQMRQNLALVIGLQGKFEEAERMARADLPPEIAENNVAFLREMLTQPDPWRELMDVEKNVRAQKP